MAPDPCNPSLCPAHQAIENKVEQTWDLAEKVSREVEEIRKIWSKIKNLLIGGLIVLVAQEFGITEIIKMLIKRALGW